MLIPVVPSKVRSTPSLKVFMALVITTSAIASISKIFRARGGSSFRVYGVSATKSETRIPGTIFLEGSHGNAQYIKEQEKDGREPEHQGSPGNDQKMKDKDGRKPEPHFELDKHCEPIADWQTTFYPNCNEFHAIFLGDVLVEDQARMLGRGHWRRAWELIEPVTDTSAVFKTTLFRHVLKDSENMMEELLRKSRKDAVAMERLTKSSFVVSSYGYCGISVAVEKVGITKKDAFYNMTSREKLGVAIKIAKGLKDVHSIDDRGRPSLTHNDLQFSNIVFTPDSRPLINDFDRGVMLKKHSRTGETCLSARTPSPLSAPEEQFYSDYENTGVEPPAGVLKDRIDIYYFGNVLFELAVGRPPWKNSAQKLTSKEAAVLKIKGELPIVPAHIKNSTDSAIQTMLKVVEACYRYDPKERPSAGEVVAMLRVGRGDKT